jgi:hypothetical protein
LRYVTDGIDDCFDTLIHEKLLFEGNDQSIGQELHLL